MSRICRLLFVNATFKIGPSSLTQSAYDLATGHSIFIGSHPQTLLEAKHHCPKVDAQKRPEHSNIRKYWQRAESLQIQTRHTPLVGYK